MERTSIETILMERFSLTEAENTEILGRFLDPAGRLHTVPTKQKYKAVIDIHLASLFTLDRIYSETEVNAIITDVVADFASFRRELIDIGLMSRSKDGREYYRNH